MAHGYRILQHWNQWLVQEPLGNSLCEAEQQLLPQLLARHFGKHAVLIGVPNQHGLMQATPIPCHTLISPLINKDKKYQYIEGDFYELPVLTGTIDLVLLPHTLEFVDNPRQLLSEACRIIKPEGLIAVCGFNPYSAWGIKKILAKHKTAPWSGSFIQLQKIKNWLQLADFEMVRQTSAMYRPPIANKNWYKKINFLEKPCSKLFPAFGGVYLLLARAKVIPLTPIRLKWKQSLSDIRISTTISGHIASHSK